MLKHCVANRKRRLSVLPNVSLYIYDVNISGFTKSSIYVYTTLVGQGLNSVHHPNTLKTINNIREHNKCVIYKPTCNTCKLSHVGQTSQPQTRYKEHIRYIKQNYYQSAYSLHILKNNHQYGPINSTITPWP
jgi:hypothetical protein